MAPALAQAVRSACVWLPQAQESTSHGMQAYKVSGKAFAYFVVNHHGDGRVALWLKGSAATQDALIQSEPRDFFIPPYVGVRGWVGVHLNKGIGWRRVIGLIQEAYERTAPATLCAEIGQPPALAKPRPASPREIDPFANRKVAALVRRLDTMCAKFPESSMGRQFGHRVWRGHKRIYARLMATPLPGELCVWVGIEQQSLLAADPRFRVPAYFGAQGWICLDISEAADWREIAQLVDISYRHFALRRMLSQLPTGPGV